MWIHQFQVCYFTCSIEKINTLQQYTLEFFLLGSHLSSQDYDICIRRARGFCGICWTASTPGTATPTLGSFGLR